MKITNICGRPRTIAATGQTVASGDVVDVPDALGKRLCDQPDVWAQPKTAKTSDDGLTVEKDDDR